MRVRAVFLRLLGVLSIVCGVFFASFFMAIAMRAPERRAAAEESAVSIDRVEAAPMVSDNAAAVPTTDPTSPVLAYTNTAESDDEPERSQAEVELDIDEVFDPIRDRLVTEVGVPVRLPGYLGDDATDWVPTISTIDENGYVVHIGSGPNCNGASACRISTFTARRSVRASPTLTGGTRVPLPNGLTGVFSDSTCGDGCNNGFITWIESGVRYTVGSRVASGQAVLDLAWRSIDRTVASPTSPDVCGFGAPKHGDKFARTITTDVGDSRSLHWIVVCSGAGVDIEIIDLPGTVRWRDLDHDGAFGTFVLHDDGTTTMFDVDQNQPRPVIDISTGTRLIVGDLGCGDINEDGKWEGVDRATGEELRFVSSDAVRRVARDDLSEKRIVDC